MQKMLLIVILTSYFGIHAMENNNYPVWSSDIERALELAAQWHDGTYRKGSSWREPAFMLPDQERPKVPVITHLAGVAMILLRTGWDDETVAAGLLHDTLEDANKAQQNLSKGALSKAVGDPVANIVGEVSEQKTDHFGYKLSWQERKDAYIKHLKTCSVKAAAVSLADKINNIRTMNNTIAAGTNPFQSTPDREALNAGPDKQVWYFNAVLDATAHHHHKDPRLQPLRHTLIEELKRFKDLTKQNK